MNGTATTTLERFTDQRVDDYCALPTRDVAVLPDDEHRCASCGQGIERDQTTAEWCHIASEAHSDRSHKALPQFRCPYCNCDDPALVTFVNAGYAYETRCARCSGVDAYTIGN